MCGKGTDENTLDAKNHQTFNCNQNAILEKSENGKSHLLVIPARSSYINIRAIPFHSMPRSPTQSQMHQHVHPGVGHEFHPRWCTHCCKSARTSGPLNVFDPWSKLFYKYTHVRRAWPSLGQVHSEFGSELEQPLASRLHWTKGAEHVR